MTNCHFRDAYWHIYGLKYVLDYNLQNNLYFKGKMLSLHHAKMKVFLQKNPLQN